MNGDTSIGAKLVLTKCDESENQLFSVTNNHFYKPFVLDRCTIDSCDEFPKDPAGSLKFSLDMPK